GPASAVGDIAILLEHKSSFRPTQRQPATRHTETQRWRGDEACQPGNFAGGQYAVVDAEVIEEAIVRRPIGIMRLAQFERLVRHPVPGLAVVMGAVEQTIDVEADETSGG